ncbi:MFS transporter [Amycolatopsis sp. CA-230715]|uniref:MFS transporter n=1 Tax=Amycolatopsis sp. CA-230715 TaxID=2745196 RepID=UPI001C0229D7|nr:hypothetical protein HUW46_02687 [Amycolatopsis sp. CA-230715]
MLTALTALRKVVVRSSRRERGGFDRRLLLPMMLGAVLNPVNSSILSVSLVPIGVAFGAPPARTAWLVSALYLATAIGQPVVGRLVDLYGPRPLYLAGAGLTGIAGVLGMLAPNLGVLIAARVVLGFGTCAGYPAAMALTRREAQRTGRDSPAGVLTALAVATQTIAVIGPSLGGLLIGLGGWRTTLAVNIPLSLVCLVLGVWRLPRTERREGKASLDFTGMAVFAVMLVSLLLFLMNPRAESWYLLAITVAAAIVLVLWERRVADPFLDVRVLAGNLPLLATYVRALLAFTGSYVFVYGYTQWMEQGRGLSASMAGLLQFPVFATAIVVSITTGRREQPRGKLLLGAAGQIVACGLMLALHETSPIWLLVLVALVFGVPQGLNNLALQNSVYRQSDPERIASSSGLLRTFGYLGAIIASAAQGAFFSHRADTGGMHNLTWFMLVLGVLLFALTAADRSLGRSAASK